MASRRCRHVDSVPHCHMINVMKRCTTKWFPLLLAVMIGLLPLSAVTAEPQQAPPPAPEAMMHAHAMADEAHHGAHAGPVHADNTQHCNPGDTCHGCDSSCAGNHCNACSAALLHAAPHPGVASPGSWIGAGTLQQPDHQPSLLFRPPRT